MGNRVTDSRIFRQGRAFTYLEEQDRFLSAGSEPEFCVGIIGCGMMGQEHIRNTLLLGRASVGGIYDPAEKSAQHGLQLVQKAQPASLPTLYSSLDEACADPRTDALLIATPNFTHLAVMRVAVRYNKAIILEKPIATSVADAFEVCRLAIEHACPVQFGLQYRYKAIYVEAIDEVFARNAVGRVHSVNLAEHRFPFLDKVGQWNKFDAYTGGVLVEKCCHYFDLMNLFAGGRPQQVFAVGNQAVNFHDFNYNNNAADGLDQAQVSVRYDNNVIGGFSLCMFVPGTKEELVVCGDTGRLQATEQARLGEPQVNQVEVWRGESGTSRSSQPSYPPYISRAGHSGSTYFEHVAFADTLASGRAHGASIEDGFYSVVLGAAAQASIEQGTQVDVADVMPSEVDLSLFATEHPQQPQEI